jgi:type IV pilus assembly protein PilF
VHNALGLDLAASGDSEQALFAFKRAADLDREWATPIVNMGTSFARLGRTARARSTWERALVVDSDNVPARLNLADLDRASGEWDAAERGYRAALALDGTQAGIRRALALVLLERGAPEEAAELLAWERARAPGDLTLRIQLARALVACHRTEEAEHELRTALAESPDSPALAAALKLLGDGV